MAKTNTKIVYDKELDILDLSRGRPSRASIEIGDFILDVDAAGYISSIEILNASENLNLSSEFLSEIKKASMQITYNLGYIKITLVLYANKKEKELVIPLSIDLGHKEKRKEEVLFS